MELRRVIGRLAPRWPVLVIAGLIGAVAAFAFVQRQNSEVEPVYRALAAVEVSTAAAGGDSRGSSNVPSEELQEALELAKTVNETELARANKFVQADAASNSLVFGAIGRTEDVAIAAATSMRAVYVEADPNFDVETELAAKLAEAAIINGRLEELLPDQPTFVPPTPEERAANEARLNTLQTRETAIKAQISELETLRIDAETSAEVADLDARIEKQQENLTALLIELDPLEEQAAALAAAEAEAAAAEAAGEDATPDIAGLPLADQWAINALTDRLNTLKTESAELIVASETGASLELPGVEVTDESPSALPSWLGLVVGFIAGALIWSAVLLGFDRARGIVWQAGDVRTVPVLAEAPAAALDSRALTDMERQRRKRSVQAIRSAIIGSGEADQGSIVGFAAPASTEPGMRDALAYDVASSISTVGRSVLLVDLGFSDSSDYSFSKRDSSGLRDLFDSVTDDEETIRQRADAAIASAESRGHGLDVLVADSDVIDPADILAGRPVSELLEQGRQRYDVVIVIQPTTTVTPGTGVDAYLQQQIVVCTRGKTRVSEIAAESIQANAPHVQLVAAALLVPVSGAERARRGSGPASAQELGSRGEGSVVGMAGDESGKRKVSSAIRRLGANDQTPSEGTVERLRALESYSVEESALLRGTEPPTDPA